MCGGGSKCVRLSVSQIVDGDFECMLYYGLRPGSWFGVAALFYRVYFSLKLVI